MTNRRYGQIIGGCLAAVLLVGVLATVSYLRTAHLIHQRDEDATQTRVAACGQFDAQQSNNRSALKGLIRVGIASAPNRNDPRLVKYLNDFDNTTDRLYPYRDCSVSGIAAYFANPPSPVSCVPDGRGFCK